MMWLKNIPDIEIDNSFLSMLPILFHMRLPLDPLAVQLAVHAGSWWEIFIVLLCELSNVGLHLSFWELHQDIWYQENPKNNRLLQLDDESWTCSPAGLSTCGLPMG